MLNKIEKKLAVISPALARKEEAEKIEPDTRVMLCGLMQARNLGDVVIADCVKYLLKKTAKKAGFKNLRILTHDIHRQKDKDSLNRIRGCDLVIFAGGGLIKYKQEKLYLDLNRVIPKAEHYGIPVAFNAVGMEGFDESHEGCVMLKNLLHSYCNRWITSRDYADALNKTYLSDTPLKATRVADPAVWAAQVYNAKRDESSDAVGLGIARAGLFEDYGMDLPASEMLDVWKNIIAELDKRNIKYKLFTNGSKMDEEFLAQLVSYLGREDEGESLVLKAPETPEELVQNIASFSSVIALRMHANIIAFSLGVPSVGFVWNEKLRFFGDSIQCGERFLEHTQMRDAPLVVDTLEKALKEGCSAEVLAREKISAENGLEQFFVPFLINLLKCRRRDHTKLRLACYGLPNTESDTCNKDFYKNNVEFFVSEKEDEAGTACLGVPVYSVKKLKKLKKPFVIISATQDYPSAARTLTAYGYKEKRDFTNVHSYRRYVLGKGDAFLKKPVVNKANNTV